MCDEQQRRDRARAPLTPHLARASEVARHQPAGAFLDGLNAHRATLSQALADIDAEAAQPCGCLTSVSPSAPISPATPSQADDTPNSDTFPNRVALTDESRANVQRAPTGTRFYCMVSPQGDAHCAASKSRAPLPDDARSNLNNQAIDPLEPNHLGTGHQQVARAVGIPFDEQSARVGYVEGDGFGFSIEKKSDCDRAYTFESAFNEKLGDRVLPEPISQQLQQQVEAAFPTCPVNRQRP